MQISELCKFSFSQIDFVMKFFIENKEIDETIREIRKKIYLSMNGIVADSMRDKGIVYKQNFGVDIPRLRQIASQYPPGHDLAQRLWAIDMRETRILATLLQPIEKMSPKLAGQWISEINQLEMAEQTAMNLFSKLPYADTIALEWINLGRLWEQVTGLLVITRRWKQLTDEQADVIIERIMQLSDTEEMALYKAMGLVLGRLSRRSKSRAEQILRLIQYYEQDICFSRQYIFQEVSKEISFLDL